MQSFKFTISGKVQGVYYRKNVSQNAQKAHFSGYVKNLPNGDVEACVSCEEQRVAEFIKILKKGSASSIVKNIKQDICIQNYDGSFQIHY